MPYLKQAYPSSVKQLTDESFLVSGGAPMCRHQSCELYSEKKTRTKKSGITLLRGYVAQQILDDFFSQWRLNILRYMASNTSTKAQWFK